MNIEVNVSFSIMVSSGYMLASLVAQMAKDMPAIQETQVQSLSVEDICVCVYVCILTRYLGILQESLRFSKVSWYSPWRREWLPTPAFLPGEFHEQKSLACYSPWGHKNLDTTE